MHKKKKKFIFTVERKYTCTFFLVKKKIYLNENFSLRIRSRYLFPADDIIEVFIALAHVYYTHKRECFHMGIEKGFGS